MVAYNMCGPHFTDAWTWVAAGWRPACITKYKWATRPRPLTILGVGRLTNLTWKTSRSFMISIYGAFSESGVHIQGPCAPWQARVHQNPAGDTITLSTMSNIHQSATITACPLLPDACIGLQYDMTIYDTQIDHIANINALRRYESNAIRNGLLGTHVAWYLNGS